MQYENKRNNSFSLFCSKWDLFKLKFLVGSLESGKRKDFENEDYALSIGGEHLNWNGSLNLKNKRFISKEFYNSLNNGKIKKHDILLVKDGATIGKTVFINNLNYKMAVNEHVFIIRNNNWILPKLLYYLICSNVGFSQIKLTETGSAQGGINQNILDKVKFPIPPNKLIQEELVKFLDKKVNNINKTIDRDKKLIELLKEKRVALINQVVIKGLNPDVPMKDSGVEWIGEIPENWEVKKIKEVASVKPSNVDKKSKEEEPKVLLCNYTDVYNNEFIVNNLPFMHATASYDQIRKLSLKKGDVIITKDSESADDIGVPAIVVEDLDNVVCGYHLAVISVNDDFNSKFLFRLLESKKINDQFMVAANGITRYGLGSYPIKNSYICIPPIKEQYKISKFLDNEISKTYQIINKVESKIDLLEEYKESLIYNVVTGKVDVSEGGLMCDE